MISSYLQLIEKRYKHQLDRDADEFIGYAVGGADRMQKLILDLLAYSRVGRRGGEFRPVNCNEIMKQVVKNLKLAIDDTDAQVTHGVIPGIKADGSQMLQLFQNLIANAVKFQSEAAPQVRVTAGLKQNQWLFSVQDNGIEIEPQHYERIFQVFQRLHPRDKYPGTGIGLAICNKIVERHGGKMWLESQPGRGSTLYFTGPAID